MPRLSSEQKVNRRKGIGASDVAELLGISPYEGASPVRLFAEKVGLIPHDDNEEETTEQRVGHALEGALVRLYERESNRKVISSGEFVESVVHPDLEWARCNLDGRIEGARIALEIKVVGIGMAADWDLLADDGIPNYVRVQVAWQCFVADLDAVHVVALIGGTGFRVFYIDRDRELERMLVASCQSFWIGVLSKQAPPLDGSSGARLMLEELYPPPPADVELAAPEHVIPIGDRRVKAAAAEVRAREAKELANNELREEMGKLGATVMWSPTWRAIWRQGKDGSRPLLVRAAGEAKQPRLRAPKANALRPPVIDDGEVF